MSNDDYSFPILFAFEKENDEIKEIEPNLIKSTDEEELKKNVSKIFYDNSIKNEKENSSTNSITPEDDNKINKVNDSNIKESNVFFFHNDIKIENKTEKKFKILNKKPKRFYENDAKLKRNLTIFKNIFTKNINEKIKEIKELKNLNFFLKNKKISFGSNKTEIFNNFNKTLIELLNDEKIYKEKEKFNLFFKRLKKIKFFESLDIYKILNEKIKILYKTLYLDFIEDDEGLNTKKETTYNFKKFNLEYLINETMNKKNNNNSIEFKEYLKDFKIFIFNYIQYLNVENKYQKNQQLKKKNKNLLNLI